jgi:hypothetical protein
MSSAACASASSGANLYLTGSPAPGAGSATAPADFVAGLALLAGLEGGAARLI